MLSNRCTDCRGANTKFWGKVSWENYSRAIHLILTGAGAFTDSKNQPIEIDFTTKRLIGIGHSMGGVSLYVCALAKPE